jgi:hypothetical protein
METKVTLEQEYGRILREHYASDPEMAKLNLLVQQLETSFGNLTREAARFNAKIKEQLSQ